MINEIQVENLLTYEKLVFEEYVFMCVTPANIILTIYIVCS